MGADLVEVGARGVDAAEDEVGADVALVPEEHLLQHAVGRAHAHLPPRVQPEQLQLRLHHGRRLVAVGRRPRAGAVHVGRHLVQLLAVLVGDDGAARRPRVGAEHNAVLEYDATDGGARLHGFRGGKALVGQEFIPVELQRGKWADGKFI